MKDKSSTQAWIALCVSIVLHAFTLILFFWMTKSLNTLAKTSSLQVTLHPVDIRTFPVINKTNQVDPVVSTTAFSTNTSSSTAPIAASSPTLMSVLELPTDNLATQAQTSTVSDDAGESTLALNDPILSAEAFEIGNAVPVFPQLSRILGESGTVNLRLHLNSEGVVTEVQIIDSSGYSRLDQAATEAVSHWQLKSADNLFSSAKWFRLSVSFKFESSS